LTFWDQVARKHKPSLVLATVARRLESVVANSVPSERAFSAMNYVQSTYRSRLTFEHTHQQVYYYMNVRALRRRPHAEEKQRLRAKMRRFKQDEALLATK